MNQFWLRASGLFGMLGGIILFAGDMLFQYDPYNTNFLENMANSSDFRIISSGVCALFAAWFYLLGLVQIYYAFKPSSETIRNLVLICFASIFVAFGVIHGAYVAIAATAKVAIQNQLPLANSVSLASEVYTILKLFVYPIFGLLSFVFIRQVWIRKTLYPWPIIFFFPLIPFLLQGVIGGLLSGKTWIIIKGGYFNIILFIFFLASTIALWNPKTLSDNVQNSIDNHVSHNKK